MTRNGRQCSKEYGAAFSQRLEKIAVAIEHVGSTAVPGLAAKDIVDIDVVVRSAADVAEGIRRLEKFGYVHKGDFGIAAGEAFANPPDREPHHLYLVVHGNEAYRNHVGFRDYLRNNPEMAKKYGELKKALAVRFRDDWESYTAAKSQFVTDALRHATELPASPSVSVGQ